MQCEGIVGIVIGTRPDTLPDTVLDLLDELNRQKPIFLEIGAETSCNHTLDNINRHHTWEDVESAVSRASSRGLRCGLHLIAGLPGEDNEQILTNVRKACSLPIETLKLHQLQILFDTPLYHLWVNNLVDVKPFDLENYLNLCRQILEMVPDNIVIERFLAQCPPNMVAAPKWGIKNYQFMQMLENEK